MSAMYKRLAIFITTCSLFAIGGSAFALTTYSSNPSTHADADPLQNISAAQTAAVGLAPVAAATVRKLIIHGSGELIAEARLLPTKVAGHRVYLIPSSRGDLCTFVEEIGLGCTSPLTSTNPATFAVFDRDGPGGSASIAFGVAEDGVQSISFALNDKTNEVPVIGNVYAREFDPSVSFEDFANVTAVFADGSRVPLQ
jgi:hypothetical protein